MNARLSKERGIPYSELDYEALYREIGWDPKESIGPEDKGFCLDPWLLHKNGDTTGKLAINRDKGVYNCWVCGGGTLPTLIAEIKQISHEEALHYIGRFIQAFQHEPESDFIARIERLIGEEAKEKKPAPIFNKAVLDRWRGYHPWFEHRGINAEVASYFRLGSADGHRRVHSKFGEHTGHAIILPHFWQGRLVGWQERWLGQTPAWVGKYTNTTDFPRQTTLWGHDFAKSQQKMPVVVESVPTALRLISAGSPSLATFGASVTEAQCRLLRIFNQGVILAPDNDGAGRRWRSKLIQELDRFIPLWEVALVEGEGSDLGDLPEDQLLSHLADVKIALPNT